MPCRVLEQIQIQYVMCGFLHCVQCPKDWLKSFMRRSTKRLKFYSHILTNDFNSSDNLVGKTILQCSREGTSILKYIYNIQYSRTIKGNKFPDDNGLVDGVKQILVNRFYNPYLLNLILILFWRCTAIQHFNVLLIVCVYILYSTVWRLEQKIHKSKYHARHKR